MMKSIEELDADRITALASTQLFIRGVIRDAPGQRDIDFARIDLIACCQPDSNHPQGMTSCWVAYHERWRKSGEPPDPFLHFEAWSGRPDFHEIFQTWTLSHHYFDCTDPQVIQRRLGRQAYARVPLCDPMVRQLFGSIRALIPEAAEFLRVKRDDVKLDLEPILTVVRVRVEAFLQQQDQAWRQILGTLDQLR